MSPPGVQVLAPAKINLYLRVLGRRPDGFHELDTVFQAISLADRVRVWVGAGAREIGSANEGGHSGSRRGEIDGISLVVDGPDLGPTESNLAHRAVRRFRDDVPFDQPVSVGLTKKIPAGAGLGGGSSDAAAVLRCLAWLKGIRDEDLLHRMAADLGSDVPFFLSGSALARGRGRGELLTPLDPLPPVHLVVALPNVHVATEEAYVALARSRGSIPPAERQRDAGAPSADEDRPARSLPFQRPVGWEDVVGRARNDFESVVVPRHPDVEASLVGLRSLGASVAVLSGSGSACFGLFGRGREAEEAAEALSRRLGWPFLPVTTLGSMPELVPIR